MFQIKICRENQNAYFVFNNFFPENHGICELMWKKSGTFRQATRDNVMLSRKGAFFMSDI